MIVPRTTLQRYEYYLITQIFGKRRCTPSASFSPCEPYSVLGRARDRSVTRVTHCTRESGDSKPTVTTTTMKNTHTHHANLAFSVNNNNNNELKETTQRRETQRNVFTLTPRFYSPGYTHRNVFFFLHIFFSSYSCPALKRVSPEGSPSSRGKTCRGFFAAPLRDNVCLLAVVTSVVGVVVLVSVSVGGVFVSLSFILRERA